MALAQHCHKLSTFEAAGCSQFTDAGFQALARVIVLTINLGSFLIQSSSKYFGYY